MSSTNLASAGWIIFSSSAAIRASTDRSGSTGSGPDWLISKVIQHGERRLARRDDWLKRDHRLGNDSSVARPSPDGPQCLIRTRRPSFDRLWAMRGPGITATPPCGSSLPAVAGWRARASHSLAGPRHRGAYSQHCCCGCPNRDMRRIVPGLPRLPRAGRLAPPTEWGRDFVGAPHFDTCNLWIANLRKAFEAHRATIVLCPRLP